MNEPSHNGNGRVVSRARPTAKAPRVPEPPVQSDGELHATTVGDHEIETRLSGLESRLDVDHPEMAAFLKSHGGEIRSMMTAALDAAVQSERRRLTWLLHNDLADILSAARERLSAVSRINTDPATDQALKGVDACIGAAAKATRGLITDLSPPHPETKKE